jgi:hypothetical protein
MERARRSLLTASAALVLSAGLLAAPAAASGGHGDDHGRDGSGDRTSEHGRGHDGSVSITRVVNGLSSPRGIAVDGLGAVYVAESGLALPGAEGVTHTGRVTKYGPGWTPAWSTSFDSLHSSENGGPEALGPEGISALGSGCTKHSSGQRNGCQVRLITSESTAGTHGASDQLGRLYRLDAATGTPTEVADVGDDQYAWTGARADLFSDFPDSNPYGVLVVRGGRHGSRTFVADAGANTVSEVLADGTVHVIAYIPNETTVAERDATPTCIAQGPDGDLYVGTLDLLSNLAAGGGQSHVYRIDPDTTEGYLTAAHLWASGLTTVSACTFDRDGDFWATEMFAPSTTGAPGDVVRIPWGSPTSATRYGNGAVALPGGIAQGKDGAMYVTTHAADPTPGSGEVLRLALG